MQDNKKGNKKAYRQAGIMVLKVILIILYLTRMAIKVVAGKGMAIIYKIII